MICDTATLLVWLMKGIWWSESDEVRLRKGIGWRDALVMWRLMKWRSMKWHFDEVRLCLSESLMEWRFDEVTLWWSEPLIKWRFDEVPLMKCRLNEMTIRWSGWSDSGGGGWWCIIFYKYLRWWWWCIATIDIAGRIVVLIVTATFHCF